MASIEFARQILRLAGEQIVNRTAYVVRRSPIRQATNERAEAWKNRQGGGINPTTQVPVLPVVREGSVSAPSWEYTGPAGRLHPSDVHQTFSVLWDVQMTIQRKEEWAAAFFAFYVDCRGMGRHRHAEYELALALAEDLPESEGDRAFVQEALQELRMQNMEERRRNVARYVQDHRARKKEACQHQELLSGAQQMATECAA
jgi:hypothetical protein